MEADLLDAHFEIPRVCWMPWLKPPDREVDFQGFLFSYDLIFYFAGWLVNNEFAVGFSRDMQISFTAHCQENIG